MRIQSHAHTFREDILKAARDAARIHRFGHAVDDLIALQTSARRAGKTDHQYMAILDRHSAEFDVHRSLCRTLEFLWADTLNAAFHASALQAVSGNAPDCDYKTIWTNLMNLGFSRLSSGETTPLLEALAMAHVESITGRLMDLSTTTPEEVADQVIEEACTGNISAACPYVPNFLKLEQAGKRLSFEMKDWALILNLETLPALRA